ncbi:hypothetical protein F2Q69_00012851 [Brassica cretica]|uniref:Uncharacterized protein n=1 Tax=Brassica cretica TaxID=69181 RepID=A0A8S9QI76_BRACR|nr:hypothetical protein F2Q69_00012851 [Brassica cretica]
MQAPEMTIELDHRSIMERNNRSILTSVYRSTAKRTESTFGTVLRLPRQDYYGYLFGFRILPLGSWPLSSSYVVFYFCRKSLTGLVGAGVGVMTQMPGFAAFHVWRSRILIAPCISQYLCSKYTMCSLYCVARSVLIQILLTLVHKGPRCALGCTGVLGSFDSILRLAHTHSCFMSHTRFDFVGVPLFARVGQDRRSLET